MSVFQKLRERKNDHFSKRSIDALSKGLKYEVCKFALRKSDYSDKSGQYPQNLLAYIKGELPNTNYYVVMPNLFNNMSEEDVEELNKAINEKNPPSIVYYGKDGQRNEVDILEHGEAINVTKLQEYLKVEDSNKKRKFDSSESPGPSRSNSNLDTSF